MTGAGERRLAAIVAADVVGFSRLVGADEEGTLARLGALRREFVDPQIAKHRGRIANTAGDSLLLEFPSAVDAVRCAAALQNDLSSQNDGLDAEAQIRFRIGINVGDVIGQGQDLLGDGVNIAARIEALAEPGGIAISDDAHRQIRDRVDLAWRDGGEHQVKNIARPIRIWHWDDASVPAAPASEAVDTPADRPSIAVLPFDNMSGDDDQAFLADGIAEDLLTNLSKIHALFVIARNSSFAYRDGARDLRRVSAELGARYIVEGSVRRAGPRVRITAQMIDGTTGANLWAERYDRQLDDIFDLQDEITMAIATALQVRLTEGQQIQIRRGKTTSFPAWQAYQQAQHHIRRFTRGDNTMAREFLETALRHDPDFVSAIALLAWTYWIELRLPWNDRSEDSAEEGLRLVRHGLERAPDDPDLHSMLALYYLLRGEHEESEKIHRRAIAFGPNVADIHVSYALLLNMRNRPEEATAMIETAMRLCPVYPDWYLGILAISQRLLGRFDEGIATDVRRLEMNPDNSFSDIRLAALHAETGNLDKARHHVKEALKKQPNYRIVHLSHTDPYEDPAMMRHYEDLLRRAGLPE